MVRAVQYSTYWSGTSLALYNFSFFVSKEHFFLTTNNKYWPLKSYNQRFSQPLLISCLVLHHVTFITYLLLSLILKHFKLRLKSKIQHFFQNTFAERQTTKKFFTFKLPPWWQMLDLHLSKLNSSRPTIDWWPLWDVSLNSAQCMLGWIDGIIFSNALCSFCRGRGQEKNGILNNLRRLFCIRTTCIISLLLLHPNDW